MLRPLATLFGPQEVTRYLGGEILPGTTYAVIAARFVGRAPAAVTRGREIFPDVEIWDLLTRVGCGFLVWRGAWRDVSCRQAVSPRAEGWTRAVRRFAALTWAPAPVPPERGGGMLLAGRYFPLPREA